MKQAVILGNGPSRKNWNYRKEYPNAFVFGCNGAYEDTDLDALVCNDIGMQHIIYSSGYCINNKCYFSEWNNPIPALFYEDLISTFNTKVVENEQTENFMLRGTENVTYVTWIQEDLVEHVPEELISTGSKAIRIACELGYTDLLLAGFDGVASDSIYKIMDRPGYEMSGPRDFWENERERIFKEYPNVKYFYRR